jgi:hypothetical protein
MDMGWAIQQQVVLQLAGPAQAATGPLSQTECQDLPTDPQHFLDLSLQAAAGSVLWQEAWMMSPYPSV